MTKFKNLETEERLPDVDDTLISLIQRKHSWLGYLFSVLAAVSSAAGGILVKIAEGNKTQIVLLRSVLQYIVLFPLINYQKTEVPGRTWKVTLLLIVQGATSVITATSISLALHYQPLGDVMAVFYTFPAWVGIFACICINEKCSILNGVLTTVALVGLLLVAQPTFIFGNTQVDVSETDRLIGTGISLLAALGAACTSVILRSLGTSVHFSQSLFYFSVEALFSLPVFLYLTGGLYIPCFENLPIMTIAAVFYCIAQTSVTLALQHGRAAEVSLVQTSQVIFAYILEYLVTGVVPSLLSGTGSGLIFMCSVVLGLRTMWKLNKDRFSCSKTNS